MSPGIGSTDAALAPAHDLDPGFADLSAHVGRGFGIRHAEAALPSQYRSAVDFERALGDPALAANTLSFRRAMSLDEAEAFPEAAMSLLQALGLPAAYVPRSLGGEFGSSETFLALGRVLARRDMSVAVSFSTMLWSALAWIGCDPAGQVATARRIATQGSFPCLAYTEAEHGADLAANQLTARHMPGGGYVLNGEKWPINRATRSGFLVLLARTDDAQGLRDHTLFIVDKSDLPAHGHYHLPKVRTLGLRGCDISGIGFRDCPLPASARVGAEGRGLELALKGFQVTRTFCCALSLGVGDSALRLVADFCARRQLYGAPADNLPHARDALANAYLSQLMAECVSIVSARGLHLHPAQFATWSSVAKVRVTQLVDDATHELAAVLGARHYLREGHGEGMFQKFLRDGAVVSLFDGSSIVCLDSLATLLLSLVRSRRVARDVDTTALFDLARPLPAVSFDRLDLFGRGRDAVLESLPTLLEALAELVLRTETETGTESDTDTDTDTDTGIRPSVLQALQEAACELQVQLITLDAAVEAQPATSTAGQRNSPYRFSLAQRHVELHGAVSMLGLWLHNRTLLGDFFADGRWLLAGLRRVAPAVVGASPLSPDLVDALYLQLDSQRRERRMFSLLNWPLAGADRPECHEPLFGAMTR